MTNTQLLLSIGIPSLLVILSWLSNNARLNNVEKRLDAHDKRLDEIVSDMNRRFTEVIVSTNKRFDEAAASTNKRFDDVISANHRDALEIMRSMTALHERVAVVESRQAA